MSLSEQCTPPTNGVRPRWRDLFPFRFQYLSGPKRRKIDCRLANWCHPKAYAGYVRSAEFRQAICRRSNFLSTRRAVLTHVGSRIVHIKNKWCASVWKWMRARRTHVTTKYLSQTLTPYRFRCSVNMRPFLAHFIFHSYIFISQLAATYVESENNLYLVAS